MAECCLFNEVEFGASWDELVRTSDRFPSTTSSVGLGRSFAWNQWARLNGVVDAEFKTLRTADAKERFATMAELLRGQGEDNAQDVRSAGAGRTIPIRPVEQLQLF